MKELEQVLARGRARWRGLRARMPLLSRGVEPVRLVLELDGDAEEVLTPAQWKKTLVDWITWLGPTRVCIKTTESCLDLALEMVRFCHRLECPTHLVTSGPVTEEEALSFVDRGLGAVTIRVAGLDESTQQQVLGTSLEAASNALYAFSNARRERERPLVVLVNIPLHEANLSSLGSIAGWAKQAGSDVVGVGLLLGKEIPVGALREVQAVADVECPAPLMSYLELGQCQSQGLRAVLNASGELRAVDGGAVLGDVREQSPEALWKKNSAVLGSARSVERPFDEVELLPEELASVR